MASCCRTHLSRRCCCMRPAGPRSSHLPRTRSQPACSCSWSWSFKTALSSTCLRSIPSGSGQSVEMPKGRLCRVALEREQVGEPFAMLLCATEQAFRGVDPADVEMQVVLPRVADPGMDLNAVLRNLASRVARARLRNSGGAGRIRVVRIEAHRSPVRRSAGALELQQVVG